MTSEQEITIDIPRLFPRQREIVDHPARFKTCCMGRRFGKTHTGTHVVMSPQGIGDDAVKKVAWMAPEYKYTAEVWRELVARTRLITKNRNSQEKRIDLVNGSSIEFWTLNSDDVARSRKYHLVIIDEAGLVKNLDTIWNTAVRATLTDYKGRAYFLGTPKGINYFKTLFDRGEDVEGYGDWASFRSSSYANPFLDPGEIDLIKKETPERYFQQEYLAEFIDDGGLVFRYIDECVISESLEREPKTGGVYVMGIDWGKHNDFTVGIVFNAVSKKMVDMVRFNQISYPIQSERLNALAKKWRVQDIQAEVNSMGESNIDYMQRDFNLPITRFTTTNRTKNELIENLSIAFEQLSIGILPETVLNNELRQYAIETLPGGGYRYNAPEGLHDDCVMSLALAWRGVLLADTDGGNFSFNPVSRWSR